MGKNLIFFRIIYNKNQYKNSASFEGKNYHGYVNDKMIIKDYFWNHKYKIFIINYN